MTTLNPTLARPGTLADLIPGSGAVAIARGEGYDWGRIGRLLGITRQGARKKFPLAPPAPPPHVVRNNRYLREQREGERMVARFRNGTLVRPQDDDPIFW